jgi:hypothetical protein
MCSGTQYFLQQRLSCPPLTQLLAQIRQQCVRHAVLHVGGQFLAPPSPAPARHPLLPYLLHANLPADFFYQMLMLVHPNPEQFRYVSCCSCIQADILYDSKHSRFAVPCGGSFSERELSQIFS